MRLSWVVTVCGVALGALPVGDAAAQGLLAPTRTYGGDAYGSPQEYRPPSPSSLDKNYGLPSFGMDGAGLPQQKTMAPEKKADQPAAPDSFKGSTQETMAPENKADEPTVPDFFAGSPEIALPKSRTAKATAAGMETPLFTTSDGSALDDTDTTRGDTMSRTDETGSASGDTALSDRGSAAR